MEYNVAQLLKEPIGSTRSYDVEEKFSEWLGSTDRVTGQVRMVRTHQGILVNAGLDIQTTLNCSRCLGEFARPSTLHIEEEFFPTVDLLAGRRLPLPRDTESALQIDADHVLDLSEVTRQCAIADLPMKPLCQPDCLGLCRLCGTNLNQASCECSIAPADAHRGALSELLHPQKR